MTCDLLYSVFLTINLFKTTLNKLLDVIIRRNISFVGCILIVAVTELNKILRSLFIALQWRRRCISSSISFNSHLVHIRWLIGVIGLLYRPFLYLDHVSSFDISSLMLWDGSPLCVRYMVKHRNIFLLMHMCAAYLNSQYLFSTAV